MSSRYTHTHTHTDTQRERERERERERGGERLSLSPALAATSVSSRFQYAARESEGGREGGRARWSRAELEEEREEEEERVLMRTDTELRRRIQSVPSG